MNMIRSAPAGPVVCVVDGDPAVRDSFQYLCQSNGQTAVGFATAGAFLRRVDELMTKCVICEAQLPDGPGVHLYRELQRRGIDVPFALLVSRAHASAEAEAARWGIQFVWPKPLTRVEGLSRFLGISEQDDNG